jgi:aldose 1-epimerase
VQPGAPTPADATAASSSGSGRVARVNTVRVASPDGGTVGAFVPDAGMVCCSLERDGAERLDRGKGLDAYASHGSTMGIPLLYPWANRLDGFEYSAADKDVSLPRELPVDPNGLPIHGALPALMRWDARVEQSKLSARLEWSLLELFPYAHEAGIEVAVASGQLSITTRVRAADATPISFGYHPYLRVPGGPRSRWRVRLPRLERLVLDERMIPTGDREPFSPTDFELGESSWDDGFAVSSQPARFEAADPSGHGIALELLEGYPFAQIYAPPGRDFICFEPMTAPTNALRSGDGLTVLQPGDEYRASFTVTAW